MTWTYNPASLSTSALFRVRFLSGDNETTDQQVEDEEINYFLTQTSDEKLVAAMVCEHLARKFSRMCDKTIGSLSVSAGARATAYAKRAAELRAEASILSDIFVGGVSISGKDALDNDADAVQPTFRVGMDDNPRAPFERQYLEETEGE